MKKIAFILVFTVSANFLYSQAVRTFEGSSKIEVKPCEIDTIKGVLYWHSKDEVNYGNTWDTGYWVGQCSPSAISGQHLFIPGKMKYTRVYQNAGSTKWQKQESTISRGQFYDSRWKKIRAEDVYALIVDRENTSAIKPEYYERH